MEKIALIDRQLTNTIVHIDEVNFEQIQKGICHERDINSAIEGVGSIRCFSDLEKDFPAIPEILLPATLIFYLKRACLNEMPLT